MSSHTNRAHNQLLAFKTSCFLFVQLPLLFGKRRCINQLYYCTFNVGNEEENFLKCYCFNRLLLQRLLHFIEIALVYEIFVLSLCCEYYIHESANVQGLHLQEWREYQVLEVLKYWCFTKSRLTFIVN